MYTSTNVWPSVPFKPHNTDLHVSPFLYPTNTQTISQHHRLWRADTEGRGKLQIYSIYIICGSPEGKSHYLIHLDYWLNFQWTLSETLLPQNPLIRIPSHHSSEFQVFIFTSLACWIFSIPKWPFNIYYFSPNCKGCRCCSWLHSLNLYVSVCLAKAHHYATPIGAGSRHSCPVTQHRPLDWTECH